MKYRILLIFAIMGFVQSLAQPTPDSCRITSLPYVQDFEDCPTYSGSYFLPCWHRFSNATNLTYDIVTVVGTNANLYSSEFLELFSTRTGSFSCVALPKLDSTLCTAGQLQMRISIKSMQGQDVCIGSMSNPSDTNTFVLMSRLSLGASSSPSEYIVPLVTPQGTSTLKLIIKN